MDCQNVVDMGYEILGHPKIHGDDRAQVIADIDNVPTFDMSSVLNDPSVLEPKGFLQKVGDKIKK